MTSRDFCFWLQGMFEVGGLTNLNAEQTDTVRRHLNLVFVHEIDPSMGDNKHQNKLNTIHGVPKPEQSLGYVDSSGIVMRC